MKRIVKRILIGVTIATIAVGGVFGVLGYREYQRVIQDRPLVSFVQAIQNEADFVRLDDVAPMFLDAIVAVEDNRFWTRNSVLDFRSLGRATWVNITQWQFREGGSTITQQVAKNMYFDDSVSLVRKVAEFFIARDLNNGWSREEILEIYINKIYYGASAYGISEASTIFFQVSPSGLSDGQATLLAGLVQSPSTLNPFLYYERAKQRQSIVIDRLIRHGFISSEEGENIMQMEVFDD